MKAESTSRTRSRPSRSVQRSKQADTNQAQKLDKQQKPKEVKSTFVKEAKAPSTDDLQPSRKEKTLEISKTGRTLQPAESLPETAAPLEAQAAPRSVERAQPNLQSNGMGSGSAPASPLDNLVSQNPDLKTNQDLINHFYEKGGNTWDGAQNAAKPYDVDINTLSQNRNGQINAGASTPSTGTTAPGTVTPGQTPTPASNLEINPNPTTVANAERSPLGRLAATEIPKNAEVYNKASELTGVPAEMIAAIHGNESQFGKYRASSHGPESGFGLDPRYVKNDWGNQQLAKHGLGQWERGTGTERSKLQSAVIAAEHLKRNAGYANIKVDSNMSQGEIAGAVTSYVQGHGAGKRANRNGRSWMFDPNDTNPVPRHPGGTSIGRNGQTIRVAPSRKESLLRWDSLLPIAQKHLGRAQQPAQPGTTPTAPAPAPANPAPTNPAPVNPTPANPAPANPTPTTPVTTNPHPPANNGNPLQNLVAQNPDLRTNQDLINHFYNQGGNSWNGAQNAANPYGVDLNALTQNRNGQINAGAAPAPTAPTAPAAPAPNASPLQELVQSNPGLRTNQDLINHFYNQGGNSWNGAQNAARPYGVDLNTLSQNRNGQIAPGTAAPANPTPGVTGPGEVPPVQGNGELGQRVLDAARRELALGVTENAGRDEDRAGHIRKYRNSVTAPGYRQNRGPEPWCADFTSYVYKQAGKPLGPEGKGFAYVPYMKNWLKDSGQWKDVNSGYKPQAGDIVVFDWDGGNPDHVGIVESVNPNGTINTIEGNTNNALQRRTRNTSTIEGYGHLN